MTNPVVRRTGSFSVVKQLGPTTPDGSVDADAPFSGTYTCRYAGDVVRQGTWSIAGTGAATLSPAADDLPASTVCSATENPPADSGLADASWTWATPVVSDPVTVEAGTRPPRSPSPTPRAASTRRSRSPRSTRDPPPPSFPAPTSPGLVV